MRRRLLQFVIALSVVAFPLVTAVTPAHADNAGSLLAMVNSLRAAHGVGPLYTDRDPHRRRPGVVGPYGGRGSSQSQPHGGLPAERRLDKAR